MARRHGIRTLALGQDAREIDVAVLELTQGRGADCVIDAVGMEAHGSPITGFLQKTAAYLPDAIAEPLAQKASVDSLAAFYTAIRCVRRSGTISLSGVYGGQADPLPMFDLFDKGVTLRMGQCHVKRWIPELLPLLTGDDDPLGVDDLTTHVVPLDKAPDAYAMFQKKQDGACKVVFTP